MQEMSLTNNVLELIKAAHGLLRDLTAQEIPLNHITLGEIGEELKKLEKTRAQASSKCLSWANLINASSFGWISFVSAKDALSFALSCSSAFAILSPIICEKYTFKQPPFKFVYNSPLKLSSVRDVHNLPRNVREIHVHEDFSEPVCQLPSTITHLHLRGDRPFSIDYPPSLKHLTISDPNDAGVIFPATLTYLKVIGNIPLNFTKNLPRNLQELHIISDDFNEPLNNLPPHLLTLKVRSGAFNQSLDFLPQTVTKLTIGGSEFNQPIDNLPSHLLCLSFPKNTKFDQPVDKLPPSLQKIKFPNLFNKPLRNLPAQLTRIKFGGEFNQPVNTLPRSVEQVTFGHRFNQPVDILPPSVQHLGLGWCFTQPLNRLPPSLANLSIDQGFFNPLGNFSFGSFGHELYKPLDLLPSTLQQLHIGGSCSYPLSSLPPLTHLTLQMNPALDDQHLKALPSSLTHFTYGLPLEKKQTEEFSTGTKTDTNFNLPSLKHLDITLVSDYEHELFFAMAEGMTRFKLEILNENDLKTAVKLDIDFSTRRTYVSSFFFPLPSFSVTSVRYTQVSRYK